MLKNKNTFIYISIILICALAGAYFFNGKANSPKILGVKTKIEKQSSISQQLKTLKSFAKLASNGNYLIILQNSNELRPTGGFIGTFAILEIENSSIKNFSCHDIYHLDMRSIDKFQADPPDPLKKYLNIENWFMRDANWEPDWPSSARQIEWFYKNEIQYLPVDEKKQFPEQLSGIIAINPEFIADLIEITGPIKAEGQKYTKQNFIDVLQYKVELGYEDMGIRSWNRKNIINEIGQKLRNKLRDIPILRLGKTIKKHLDKKNILIYLKNEKIQSLAQRQGWAGEIKQTNGDYFMVVDTNMASFKTDAVITRDINYNLTQNDSKLTAELKIHYSHGGGFDWKTTKYRTYVRIYVPEGSKLISANGFTDGNAEISNTFGKTCFGGFISIKPGASGNLSFIYNLPDHILSILEAGEYKLYAQKQPGSNVKNLTVNLNFDNPIIAYTNSAGTYNIKTKNHSLTLTADLDIDREFMVEF